LHEEQAHSVTPMRARGQHPGPVRVSEPRMIQPLPAPTDGTKEVSNGTRPFDTRKDRVRLATDGRAAPAQLASPLTGALTLALVSAALVLFARVVILPWIESVNAWVVPIDCWTPLPAARSVANADIFHLYEPFVGRTGYPYTPGLPILLAPFVAIGDHFHLLGDYFFTQRHPKMFLVLGPAEALVGVFPIVFVAGRAVGGDRARMWCVQGAVFVVAGWVPVAWFHPEDTIACALLIAACLRAERDDWRVAGALLGGALLFKQWALWPALPFVLAAPRGKKSLTVFYAFALPGLVLVPFLLSSPATWSSLAGTRASLLYGQPQLWLSFAFGHQQLANATLLRVLWGGVTVMIARRLRHHPTAESLLAAVGTIMLVRLLFEPVLFGYYLVPPTVIAVIWCARNGRPIAMRALTASLLCAFCLPHTFPQPVFFAMLALGLAYVCGPMVEHLVPRGGLRIPPSAVLA
jgi:hypothetical protein